MTFDLSCNLSGRNDSEHNDIVVDISCLHCEGMPLLNALVPCMHFCSLMFVCNRFGIIIFGYIVPTAVAYCYGIA